jgi:maltokinase
MAEPVQVPAAELRQCLDADSLREWVQHQRWYASKSRAVTGIEIVEGVSLREDPLLFLALVQTRFATSTHELYQLPLALRPAGEQSDAQAIAQTEEWTAYDALTEPTRLT